MNDKTTRSLQSPRAPREEIVGMTIVLSCSKAELRASTGMQFFFGLYDL